MTIMQMKCQLKSTQIVDRTWTENKIGKYKFKMCTADASEMQAKIQPLGKNTTVTKRLGWN